MVTGDGADRMTASPTLPAGTGGRLVPLATLKADRVPDPAAPLITAANCCATW